MFRRIVFALIAICLGFLGLEAISRLAEFKLGKLADRATELKGWQAEFFSRLFDWHEPDPELLWRFKPNLDNPLIKTNSDHLLGEAIPKRKERHIFRVLLLGDSSPVGLGLKAKEQTFGKLLEMFLSSGLQGKYKVEMINAAVSGYTSEQILRFLEKRGWSFQPDMVLLYCGNNDASISGPYSDRELFQQQKFVSLRGILNSSALYRLLSGLLTSRAKYFGLDASSLKVRVSPEEFEENLRSIILQCREKSVPVVIIKPPAPYLWPAGLQFRLFTRLAGADGELIVPEKMSQILGREIKYCLDTARFRKIYGKGDFFTRAVFQSAYSDSLSIDSAREYYRAKLRENENDPVLWNNLGVTFWQRGEYAQADHYLKTARQVYAYQLQTKNDYGSLSGGSPFLYNIGINLLSQASEYLYDTTATYHRYLDSALQADYFSLRIKRKYWDIIDRLDTAGVTVIDLPHYFYMNGGERLFIDHCHPTAEGHRLIARVLTDKILSNGLSKTTR